MNLDFLLPDFSGIAKNAAGKTRSDAPKPSAYGVAAIRAAHQFLDKPLIFTDPLAFKILEPGTESVMRKQAEKYHSTFYTILRTSLVIRSRVAEDAWELARAAGVRQYVVLGAGLDTYAYRQSEDTLADGSQIFEVDLPTTQQWKRHALQGADISAPANLHYVAIDFESEKLLDALSKQGFRRDQPAIFSWLGVVMYLDTSAILDTFKEIASLPNGTQLIFDYPIPLSVLPLIKRVPMELFLARLAQRGEPWKSFFTPSELSNHLQLAGFKTCQNLTPELLQKRFLQGRNDQLRLSGASHIMHASV